MNDDNQSSHQESNNDKIINKILSDLNKLTNTVIIYQSQ